MTILSLFILMGLLTVTSAQIYELCAGDFNPNGRPNHLFANVNRANKVTLNWYPVNKVYAEWNAGTGELHLTGTVYPDNDNRPETRMEVDLVYSDPQGYRDCFCASPELQGGSWENPSYRRVQKRCTRDKYFSYAEDEDDPLLFCPKCENDLCREADRKRNSIGTPMPVYADWKFFKTVSGGFTGPGVKIFRGETYGDFFPGEDVPEDEVCTMSTKDLPLSQFSCSDLEDPGTGYGYGVNGKNLQCGMSGWFNCEEDLPMFEEPGIHVADINMNLIICPTDRPTASPTQSPLTKLELCNCIIPQEICVGNGGVFVPNFVPG